MPNTPANIVQKIFLLATGVPASVKLRAEILNDYASTGNWQAVATHIDDYMNAQLPLIPTGVSGLLQKVASNALGLKLTDSEAAQAVQDLLDHGIDTWSKLFMFVIGELDVEKQHVLEQRSIAAESFTNSLAHLGKDNDYHSSAIFNAVREWIQGVGQSNISMVVAQQSIDALIARFADGTVHGTAMSPYVSGATVFIDKNDNGVWDTDEHYTLTDEFGGFSLIRDVSDRHYIAAGGIDSATGKPFAETLMAPEGAIVMTPLTALIKMMLHNDQAPNIDTAEEWLFKAFDIPRVDMSVFDPVATGLYGQSKEQQVTAVKIQAAIAQIANLLTITRSLVSDFVPRYFKIDQFTFNTLLVHVIDSVESGERLDLSNELTLATLIKDTAILLGIIDEKSTAEQKAIVDLVSEQAAELLHGMNLLIQQSADQFANGHIQSAVTAFSNMVKVQSLIQSSVITAIMTDVSGGDLQSIVKQYTSNQLLASLDKIETGFLDKQTPVNDGSALTNPVVSSGSGHAPKAFSEFFLNFDGTDDYIQIGNDSNLEMSATMTMEAWIKPDSSSNANQMIINKEGEYEVGLFPDGTVRWAFKNTNPGWDWHNTGHVVAIDEWTHVAVSYDNGIVKTYIDGVLVHTYNGSGLIGDAHAALDDLRIGGRSNNPPGKYFDGAIAEVRIWNIARTGAEIAANYDQKLLGTESGLVGNWRLSEGTGSVVNDMSSLGNDGTRGGGVTAQQPSWDEYSVLEDGSLSVPAFLGILRNDSDDIGHTLTTVLLSGTKHGALNLNSDGSFTYVPDANFAGIDSFTYKANDGIRNGNFDIVTITITNVNDDPIISSDGGSHTANLAINENSTSVTTVTATDSDTGDTLSYSISGGNDQALFDIDSVSGVLSFASAPDFETPIDAGTDNIYELSIEVSDGQGGFDTQALSVTVNDIFGF